MKTKVDYVSATREIIKNTKILSQDYKQLPDLGELFVKLLQILKAINALSIRDLALIKIQFELKRKNKPKYFIPPAFGALMNLTQESLYKYYTDCLSKNKKNPSADQKVELYAALVSNLSIDDNLFHIIDFINENYIKHISSQYGQESFALFIGLICLEKKQLMPSDKISTTIDVVKEFIQIYNSANEKLNAYKARLEKIIIEDFFANQEHYEKIINLDGNKIFVNDDIYSDDRRTQIKGLIRMLSHKELRKQLIEKEEDIFLPKKAGEFSSIIIDELERYAIVLEAKERLNDPRQSPLERMKSTYNLIEKNNSILTKSRDSFYMTLIKGVLSLLSGGLAIPFLWVDEDDDVISHFNSKQLFFSESPKIKEVKEVKEIDSDDQEKNKPKI
ncbi:MAG: hypothetical protein H0U70_13095 [Tatlockia sp.]|nr:hypothetical protein [Tatlockia sp.]